MTRFRWTALAALALAACASNRPSDPQPAAEAYTADLTGLWGESCALEVERILAALPSVASVKVDAVSSRGRVVAASGAALTADDLNAALAETPYRVTALRVGG